jgi:3-deoxy-manno-octulosonate cytidylyltransferase (CMP-KDO synthetase)
MSSVVILIPARFGSSRFPGKPLAQIAGVSMVERVYKNCSQSGYKTFVVTDHDLIESEVKKFGGEVIRIDDDVPSGSERIALAYDRFLKKLNPQLVINVQGDEPLLTAKSLRSLAEFHLSTNFNIVTLIKKRSTLENDFLNPNVVKAVWSPTDFKCHYFSRQSLPYSRDQVSDYPWYQHIGVYSYRPDSLLKFVKLPVSNLENLEKLEQLRAIENQMSIGAILTDEKLLGVDSPEDIKKVEEVLRENSK